MPNHYIDGQWVPRSTGATLPVIDPVTGEEIGRLARGNDGDVGLAVAAARRALGGTWGRLTATEYHGQ